MSDLPEIIELRPEEEAARIWAGAEAAMAKARQDLVALFEALDLGLRTVEILVTHRLQSVRDQFPATISIQLEIPDPHVDQVRDAMNVPNSLPFVSILDLLGAEDLQCCSPGLHRGWEDRRFSCRRSRVTAQDALGFSLSEEEQTILMRLSAYRNRIFRCPPPVRVVRDDILQGFGELSRLVKALTTFDSP